MSDRFKKPAIIVAFAAAVTTTGLAFAYAEGLPFEPVATLAQAVTPSTSAGPKSEWLNLGQIYDQLTAVGYTDVREIERERNGYEAKARNPQGRHVKLYIDPLTGKIVKEKVRNDD